MPSCPSGPWRPWRSWIFLKRMGDFALFGRFASFVGPDALIGPLAGFCARGISPLHPILAFPLGGRWHGEAVTDEGAGFGFPFVGRAVLQGSALRGGLLCPRRLVVAKSTPLRFRLAAKTAFVPLLLLFPANPLRWALPGVTRDWTKRHRGRGRWTLRAHRTAFPGPHYGGRSSVNA